jgi:hypothetical protein
MARNMNDKRERTYISAPIPHNRNICHSFFSFARSQ